MTCAEMSEGEMDMLSMLVVSFLLLICAACVTTTEAYFKAGSTSEDFRIDREQCRQQTLVAVRHDERNIDRQPASAMVDECLSQKGWRKASPEELEQLMKRE